MNDLFIPDNYVSRENPTRGLKPRPQFVYDEAEKMPSAARYVDIGHDSKWDELELGLPADVMAAAPAPCSFDDNYDVVVVCAGVIEHLGDPRPVLRDLRKLRWNGCRIIVSTATRDPASMGPPADVQRVREWTADEFRSLLEFNGFMGGRYAERDGIVTATFWARVMRFHSSNGCHYKGCSVCGGNGKCYSSMCEICYPRG